jgi:hypothetical protein
MKNSLKLSCLKLRRAHCLRYFGQPKTLRSSDITQTSNKTTCVTLCSAITDILRKAITNSHAKPKYQKAVVLSGLMVL